MTNLNHLLGVFLISTTLFFSSCGEDTKEPTPKNSPEYNLLASVENPAALISVNIMDLLEKSNVKESEDMPAQFKMIVNSQLNRHFNSENQGFELEGNIPFIVSTTAENDFNYVMTYFNVLDIEKVGPSLCLYFNGKVEKNDAISTLEANFPGTPMKGHFVWDDKKLIFVATEKSDSKAIALEALASQMIDAPENSKITEFLAQENDFTTLLFMDNYTKMINKISKTKMGEELIAAYDGLTVSGSGNFNNGGFIFETDLEGEKFINSKFNTVSETPIDKSFYSYLTDNNQLIAYAASSLNTEAIVNAMNQSESEYSNYDDELSKLGLKKEDLSIVFDGQFSASFMDIESIPTEGYEGNIAFNKDRPKVLITLGLKDKEKLSSILSNISNVEAINNYFKAKDLYFGVFESKLFISLNEELIQKLVAGEKLTDFEASINKPIYGSVITDMNQLPESYKSTLLRNGGEEILKFYNQVKNIEFNGDINHTEFKIEFTEQSKNSFEVLSNSVLKNILPLLMNI